MKFTLRDDAGCELEIEVADLGAAMDEARDWAEEGDWNEPRSTIWTTVRIIDGDGDVIEEVEVSIDPDEPACSEDEHAWGPDHVFGHGGGVVIIDDCAHCGLRRIVDTWAQNPVNGQQGLRSLTFQTARDRE